MSTLIWRLELNRLELLREQVSSQAGNRAQSIRNQIERSMTITYTLAELVRYGMTWPWHGHRFRACGQADASALSCGVRAAIGARRDNPPGRATRRQ
ncbi:MAG: hypothetical protein IPI21_06630 [Propionivibrio sp.]|nr:hypothetical protein [Propionivibrio sp.]